MLAGAGHVVTNVDMYFYEGCDFVGDSVDVPTLSMDVRDVTEDTLQGYDAIVYLEALSNDPLGELDAELTREINFRATVELARNAKEAGVRRFVFVSSRSMYGASGMDNVMTEDAPLRPLAAYAGSKVRAEEALPELADDDFAPVYMRNATAYGGSPRVRFDVVLNNLAGAWAFTSGKVLIISDGTPWRPLVHLRDIATAAAAALAAPVELIANQAFNMGANSENYRVRELAEIVHETCPGCEIEYANGSWSRSEELPGRLLETVRDAAGCHAKLDGQRRSPGAARCLPVDRSPFPDRRHVHATLEAQIAVESGSLDDELRWSYGYERT